MTAHIRRYERSLGRAYVLRHDTNGRVYFDKKIREGKTPKEAIRALKRRISDAVYRALTADVRRASTS